jgi:hypothetical protein
VSLGGGTAALAATGPSAADPAPQSSAMAALLASTSFDVDLLEQAPDLTSLRASRDRAARAPAEAQPVEPAPAPPPPVVAPVLPGCGSAATSGYANGRIPASALCALPGHSGHKLRADAARAFVALSEAYRADTGRRICLTDSYRSYEAQVQLRRAKGRLAAAPGRSNHGTGIAVDFCGGVESFGTAAHRWMKARAGEFGWVQPSWARAGGSKPEPWHWEYRG